LETFVNNANNAAPVGLRNLIQGSGAWKFIPTEKHLVKNAIQGIALALTFSFIIVLVSTRNIINTILAIFCVGMVIMSITAFYFMKSYQFGTTESISVVVLIGFSVDYTIHYSAEYMHSKEETRDLKMR
jgi:predicted RND superfamily exporter protein